ncbi:MAG: response regulator [Candidatus Cloacimonetes bacterium]|nr:response regulator [Candidatus Cloacimonadota bacterium]
MRKILVVEDNDNSRVYMAVLLKSQGYEVLTANNGKQALDILEHNVPDLIISDIMMPVMNGYRLCREIKHSENLRQIPFLFYSATFVEAEDEKLALRLGADRFIVKPEKPEILLKIIQENIEKIKVDENKDINDIHDTEEILKLYDGSVSRKLEETVEKLRLERNAYQQSEQKLKEAEEIADIGHWDYNIITGTTLWSDQIYRIFGFRPGSCQACYRSFLKQIHPDDRKRVNQCFRNSLRKANLNELEHRLKLKDGTIKYVHSRLQTQFDDYGKPNYVMGILQNITSKKLNEIKIAEQRQKEIEMMKKMEESQKLETIGILAGGIAHDFNNILTGIIGFSQIGLMSLDDQKEIKNSFMEILQAGNRAKELVQQILKFSRQAEMKALPMSIKPILREIIKFMRASLPASIIIDSEISTEGFVMADPVQIHQIILNIITNAGQAISDNKGKIFIKLNREVVDKNYIDEHGLKLKPGNFIVIAVSDNGAGIPLEIKSRIFDPFFTTKHDSGGTGLGLSVVYGIVTKNHGDILVRSEINKGTTFVIFLPEFESNELEIKEEPIIDCKGNESLVIIDDEEQITKVLHSFLNHVVSKLLLSVIHQQHSII